MKYCSKCGKEILENSDICLECGCLIQQASSPVKVNKFKASHPSIAPLVLGCIGLFYTLLFTVLQTLSLFKVSFEVSNLIFSIILLIFTSSRLSFCGLLGILSGLYTLKIEQNNFAKSGIILGSLSLSLLLFAHLLPLLG
ncbi:MAG: hypothetical protein E7363_01835 [Clostridiales bacterium]|nr:hypothetical protein [Clostridiales bacterium]